MTGHLATHQKAEMRYVRLSYAAMIIVAIYLAGYGSLWMGLSPYPIMLFVFATCVYSLPVALFVIVVEMIVYFRSRAPK